MRRILLEVNHPGQVHLFKNIYNELTSRGNKVWVITKRNNSIEYLLRFYSIPYQIIGVKKDGLFQKAILQLTHNFNAYKLVRRHKIEIGIGSSITNDHVSLITKMRAIHFSDDDEDVVPFISNYSYPFSDLILSPDCTKFIKFKYKSLGYSGYHELAYLHPNRFTPDLSVISNIGIKRGDPYFILRFVSLKGHHDIGEKGLSKLQKLKLISILEKHGRIFITSENKLEPELEKYRLPVPPENIHSLLYYATMFIGDSQTMTSEAAVLGTPAIRMNSFVSRISYLEEEEHKYKLTFGFKPNQFDLMIAKIIELLNQPNLKDIWKKNREQMLAEKIDVTAFMVWFIENYPESVKIMRNKPDYQNRFLS